MQILSAALLLRFGLNLEAEAARVEAAVDAVLAKGLRTGDLKARSGVLSDMAVDCAGMGDAIAAEVLAKSAASSP